MRTRTAWFIQSFLNVGKELVVYLLVAGLLLLPVLVSTNSAQAQVTVEHGHYDYHDWYEGNPDWLEVWFADETGEILEHFFDCLDFTIVAFIIIFIPYANQVFIIIIFDYWWPEVIGETGNYCIGSFITGHFRDIFLGIKEELVPLFLGSIHTEDGQDAFGWEAFQALRDPGNNPNHLGQSHNDQVNVMGEKARHYEAHLYRTFWDSIISLIASESDSWEPIDCIRQCLEYNPPDDWFPINWSEALLSPVWRFPELSLLRLGDDEDGADEYTDYYEQAALYSYYPGYLYYGTSMSPFLRDGGFTMPNITNPTHDLAGDLEGFMDAMEMISEGYSTELELIPPLEVDTPIGTFGMDFGIDLSIEGTESMFDTNFFGSINDVYNSALYSYGDELNALLAIAAISEFNMIGMTHYSCTAYRCSNRYLPRFAGSPYDKNPIWEVIRDPITLEPLIRHEREEFMGIDFDEVDAELSKTCYHQSLGQLYPLIGAVWGNAERVAPITATRRLWEWQSMNMWGDLLRQNYYNDFGTGRASGDDVENFFREPGELETRSGSRSADTIQRIFPSTSSCFRFQQVDERNFGLFPRGMYEEDEHAWGIHKIVQWNRRRCMIIIWVNRADCPWGIPLEE